MASQNVRILSHLLNGGVVDPLTAINRFGCRRLAARIQELRKIVPIRRSEVRTQAGRVAVYFIAPENRA
jgi:hypothetical protein